MKEDLMRRILNKKAKGYVVKERTDEYAVNGGAAVWVKRKIVTKHVPPDLSALKVLMELDSLEDNLGKMTDEQLAAEKLRLLSALKEEENNQNIQITQVSED